MIPHTMTLQRRINGRDGLLRLQEPARERYPEHILRPDVLLRYHRKMIRFFTCS